MKKYPFFTFDKLKQIVREYPTPFYLYDEKGIRNCARALNEAFAWNKGFKEYFAVKSNPNPYLLKILKEEGCGVDCSSLAELKLAEIVGFKDNEIMFTSNDTPEEEFIYASELDSIINFDDETHIDFYLQKSEFVSSMGCRYNPGGEFILNNSIMSNPKDAKFGMTHDQLLRSIKKMSDGGVKNLGLHAFLSSNTLSNDYLSILARLLFNLAVEIKNKLNIKISYIDLSGGVGVDYKETDIPNDIKIIGEKVHEVFDEILVPNGLGDLKIYTELGRFMLAPYGVLVTKAIHEKHIWKEYIGVDACAANLLRPAMYQAYHQITVMGKENLPNDFKYDIVGSLCENNDKFAVDRYLPKIDIGDYLVIHDAGAHGFSMGYNYNGRLRSKELLLCLNGSVKQIRRAETLDDYFATLDLSEFKH